MTTWIIYTDDPTGDAITVPAELSGFARKASANTFEQINTFEKPIVLEEVAATPDAVANAVVLYAIDNGSGKTRLMARFPTGAAQQIAIEP